jgi:hypothetical protein
LYVGSILGIDHLVDDDPFCTVAYRRKRFANMLIFRAMIANGLTRLVSKGAVIIAVIDTLFAAAFLGSWDDRFAVLVLVAAVLTRVCTACY